MRTVRTPTPPRRAARNDAGFTLLALLIAVVVINIGLGVATVRWSTLMQRQREVELVWRGEQYARALACYQEQEQTLPTELEELVEARCIRHLYADPVSRSGRWQVIRAADLAPDDAAALLLDTEGDLPPAPDPTAAGLAPAQRGLRARSGLSATTQDTESAGPGVGSSGRQAGLAGRLLSGRPGQDSPTRPRRVRATRDDSMEQIVGVVSTSSAEALGERDGMRRYDEWQFMVGSAPPASIPGWVPDRTPGPMGETQPAEPRNSPTRGLRSRHRQSGGMPQ